MVGLLLSSIAVGVMQVPAMLASTDIGLGAEHYLMIFTLPWSLPALAIAFAIGEIAGIDGSWLFVSTVVALPVIAGAAWGAVYKAASNYRSRRHSKQGVRTAEAVALPSMCRRDACTPSALRS